MEQVVIVGSGHLARALWEGWHRNPGRSRVISILARSDAHRHLWRPEIWETVRFTPEVVNDADVVVLTVKPKDTAAALERLTPHMSRDTILVSPVAGWSVAELRQAGVKGPIARIMPNVSAAIGASPILVFCDGLDEGQDLGLEEFIGECGPVTRVSEDLMNPYTALIGSGPAYVFLLLKTLIESGIALGTEAEMTRDLVSSMVEGAARLAKDRSFDSLDDWIGQVASPGGTTEALLRVLGRAGWPEILQDAVVAASSRADRLGASGHAS